MASRRSCFRLNRPRKRAPHRGSWRSVMVGRSTVVMRDSKWLAKPNSRPSAIRTSPLSGGPPPHVDDQVGNDEEIDHERHHARPGHVPNEFVDLERHEGCRRDYGQVFRPGPRHPQAHPFDGKQRCVQERHRSDHRKSGCLEVSESGLNGGEASVSQMPGEAGDPAFCLVSSVGIDELESAETDSGKKKCLRQFEDRYGLE